VNAYCRLKNSDCKDVVHLSPPSVTENPRWDHVRSNQPLAADQCISRTKPLQENDLIGVTATLKESTAAIERQTDSLRRHWECQLPDTFKRLPRGDALELQRLQFAVSSRNLDLASYHYVN
jgi:hypothetical protein